MTKRSFFLFFILLLTLPLTAGAQQKKCRLCDPPDPPAREPVEEPLGDRLILGTPGTWSTSGSGTVGFAGISITFLASKNFGLEASLELNGDQMKDVPMEDQESRVNERFALSGIWFFHGMETSQGFSPYARLGYVFQSARRYDSRTDDTDDVSVPFALQIGAGIMARYRVLNLGVEVSAISPGFSVENEPVQGSLNFRIFLGFHVDNLLWALLLPLAFI